MKFNFFELEADPDNLGDRAMLNSDRHRSLPHTEDSLSEGDEFVDDSLRLNDPPGSLLDGMNL
ncbi:hypothetical protein [Spirosoma sp. KNUC1025]|uniref:hypothetical protein n=1 Tax=Spirosoma sp. KNUC1025 TaxID=2894082 RepID=UPI001E4CD3B2|nr:hypothetical protein [Spirosoma sp. KNUC1025]UFH57496.1 hypothetical protein LN737_30800 [Spirosoma sp. KNUC1025]